MCVVVLQPGDVLIGIKRGQRGYYQMYDGMVKGEAARSLRPFQQGSQRHAAAARSHVLWQHERLELPRRKNLVQAARQGQALFEEEVRP